MTKQYYVYILTNKSKRSLYVGITSNLQKRIWEHKNKVEKGFTEKYNVTELIYYEVFDNPEAAIKREKRLKFWHRKWKEELIEKSNPEWNDLYETIYA